MPRPVLRLTHTIRGLFQFTSPVRRGPDRGVVLSTYQHSLLLTDMNRAQWPVVREVHGEEIAEWSLDLRHKTGRLHAAEYVAARWDRLAAHGIDSAHDLQDKLNVHTGRLEHDPRSLYYGAYVGAGQGDDLDAAEQRALAEVVLWVAERAP